MYGKFHSVLTNAQLPQPGTAEPGSVYWVNSTGLLWFGAGDGSLIQLLQSVPIPVKGDPGEQGIPGPIGPQGPALFFQGNWQGSPVEYVQGSIVTYNGNLWLANERNIGNPPPSNPYWTLLGALASQTSEIVFACDGAGTVPALGFKGYIPVPYNCKITGWTVLADQQGRAVFDVRWTTFSALPTTSSIVGSSNPQLVSAQKAEGSASSWSPVTFNAGDILEIDLLSASTATFLTLALQITAS